MRIMMGGMKAYGYSATINVKVTPATKMALRTLATFEGLMLSDVVREALLDWLLDNGFVDPRLIPAAEPAEPSR